MRSCVDFPEPSDHSTIMSVPGLSSAEKNISFLGELELRGSGESDDFLTVAINKLRRIYI